MTERLPEEGEYVLGTHGEELRRLGFQHQVWAPQTTREWQAAGFGPGQRLLDVGCGPGYAALDLAQLVGPAGSVLGVDLSERFLRHLQQQAAAAGLHNLRVDRQDVEALRLEPESVDGAFARWVLCFTSRPAAVIRGVAQALKPGAPFLVIDYCAYRSFALAPPDPVFTCVVEAADRSVKLRGGSMDVGGDLPRLMREAGLEVARIEPIVRLARPGSALWEWPGSFFSHYVTTLVEMELLSLEEARAFHDLWRRRSADPDAFLITPPIVAVTALKR